MGMVIDFNTIGKMLSMPGGEPFVVGPDELGPAGENHPFIKEGILKRLGVADSRWTYSSEGMARFLAKRLDLGEIREFGGVFHLGRHGRENIYYSSSPPSIFFGTHRENASIIIGAENCELPVWWTGRAALLGEMFYLDDAGEIAASRDAVGRVLPQGTGLAKHPMRRKIHERRMAWLRFFTAYFAGPYLPSRIHKNHVRFDVVRDWFFRNAAPAPRSLRTYQRDIVDFTHFNEESDLYDKREELIAVLWKYAADPKFPHGPEIAHHITELVLKLKKEEEGAARMKPVEIGRAAWQWLPGGKRELAVVAG